MDNKGGNLPIYTSGATPVPGTMYISPTTPIWSLGEPRTEPYTIITPALKLFFTDLVDISKSLQELKLEHTPPQVPTNVRKLQFSRMCPEVCYLARRHRCVAKFINEFVPTPGDQRMASEVGELSKYVTAINNFYTLKILMCMVEGARDMTLVFLKSDIKDIMAALGVLKADYAAAQNAGTDSFLEIVNDSLYLNKRVKNIEKTLAKATKMAKRNSNHTAISECEEIKEMVRSIKAFRSKIDQGVSKTLFKGMFASGKPGAPSAALAGGSNDLPSYSSLNLGESSGPLYEKK